MELFLTRRMERVKGLSQMIPPFDSGGDLPTGVYQATWSEFKDRFCIFGRSDQRLKLCRQIEQLFREARASQIVHRIIFGGSFVTNQAEPNDFESRSA